MRPDGEKRTIQELGFRVWLTDVLWYHYKGVILFSVAAVLCLSAFLLLRENDPRPDAVVMVLTTDSLGVHVYSDLHVAAASKFPDLNGDGQSVVSLTEILLESTGTLADAALNDNQAKLATSFLHPDTVVYLMDQTCMEKYASEPGRYSVEQAAVFGAAGPAISLENTPWAKKHGLTGENTLYACIKSKPYNISLSDEAYYAKAQAIIKGLMEAEMQTP